MEYSTFNSLMGSNAAAVLFAVFMGAAITALLFRTAGILLHEFGKFSDNERSGEFLFKQAMLLAVWTMFLLAFLMLI